MIELRLTTRQGTSDNEVILIADLWAGEGTLYDPESHTEVTVWLSKAFLYLNAGSHAIKSGSRFGEQRSPTPAVTKATTKTERVSAIDAQAGGSLSANATGQASGLVRVAGRTSRSSRQLATTIRKQEYLGPAMVSASGDIWEITMVGQDPVDAASIERGTSRLAYLNTDDHLCILAGRNASSQKTIEASVYAYPSALHYRISNPNGFSTLRQKLSMNQMRLIDLLLRKGITNEDRGLRLAQASLTRNVRKHDGNKP